MDTHPIIPAQPGWSVLHVDPDTGELFCPDPILAWEMQRSPLIRPQDEDLSYVLTPWPITVNGRDGDGYVLRPDGVVESIGDRGWPSLETANAPEEREHRRGLKAKAQP